MSTMGDQPSPLSRWKYKNKSLQKPKFTNVKECVRSNNALDLTAFVIDDARQNGNPISLSILATSDNLVRLLVLKSTNTGLNPRRGDFDLSRQERRAAAVAYAMIKGENREPCKQCDDRLPGGGRGRGPFNTCHADSKWFRGGCFNCYYSGTARNCSFITDPPTPRPVTPEESPEPEIVVRSEECRVRKRTRTQEFLADDDNDDSDEIMILRENPVMTPGRVRDATTRDLEIWKNWIEHELDTRTSSFGKYFYAILILSHTYAARYVMACG
ncbi:hypothetical protein BJ166DRAFT_512084 [Pestalotiopsis sp. NC0098]|nr:hypothetical protein BJ166DRAFT_512084 [Pestalotiopsis sp. NC0098]